MTDEKEYKDIGKTKDGNELIITHIQKDDWYKFNSVLELVGQTPSSNTRYIGNISDLWEYFSLLLINRKQALGKDYIIYVESAMVGRIYFLEKCKNSIDPSINKNLRLKLKQQLSHLKEKWFENLDYSVSQTMISNFFEVILRKDPYFHQPKTRKNIIKTIFELRFTQKQEEMVRRYLWIMVEGARKTAQLDEIGYYLALVLIISLCYTSFHRLAFSTINISQFIFSKITNGKASELINLLEQMEKEELRKEHEKLLITYMNQ